MVKHFAALACLIFLLHPLASADSQEVLPGEFQSPTGLIIEKDWDMNDEEGDDASLPGQRVESNFLRDILGDDFKDLFLEVNGSVGYTGNARTFDDGFTIIPEVIQLGGGFNLGWWFTPSTLIGLNTQFHYFNQYRAGSGTAFGVGNQTGWRYNLLAPFIGMRLGDVFIKTNLQLFGDFALKQPLQNAGQLRYQQPIGTRVDLQLPLFSGLWGGIYAETLHFYRMEVGASGVTDLVNPYWLWNSGFSLSVPL